MKFLSCFSGIEVAVARSIEDVEEILTVNGIKVHAHARPRRIAVVQPRQEAGA